VKREIIKGQVLLLNTSLCIIAHKNKKGKMSPQNINDRKIIIILFKHKRTMVWRIYIYRREEGLVEYVNDYDDILTSKDKV
jgi:hypothetical protein